MSAASATPRPPRRRLLRAAPAGEELRRLALVLLLLLLLVFLLLLRLLRLLRLRLRLLPLLPRPAGPNDLWRREDAAGDQAGDRERHGRGGGEASEGRARRRRDWFPRRKQARDAGPVAALDGLFEGPVSGPPLDGGPLQRTAGGPDLDGGGRVARRPDLQARGQLRLFLLVQSPLEMGKRLPDARPFGKAAVPELLHRRSSRRVHQAGDRCRAQLRGLSLDPR
mmetsp:Transcript_21813/g.64987  ORF Transcript_21813/g.64987 Transcript_21813/m.64987 type:complete len:224 (-) Transcript_21813:402-1073(-)